MVKLSSFQKLSVGASFYQIEKLIEVFCLSGGKFDENFIC